MSLAGVLEEFSLEEILNLISKSKKSGSLTLRVRGQEAWILFTQGRISEIRLNSSWSNQVCQENQNQGKCKKEELAKYLAELLLWERASFQFDGVDRSLENQTAIESFSLEEVFGYAQQRLARLQALREQLPPADSRVRISTKKPQKINVSYEEWALLCCLSKEEDLRHLQDSSQQDSLSFYETLLQMLKENLLEEVPKPKEPESQLQPEDTTVPLLTTPSASGKYVKWSK